MEQLKAHLGMHYFADMLHYRENDLKRWLPILKHLGVPWLVLHTSARSLIPEGFIKGLLARDIQPILHLQPSLVSAPSIQEFSLLFKLYSRWGLKHVVLFDRPNQRQSWSIAEWVQANPVDRFLDIFIPRAEAALEADLRPVFPPLEPGGDYWDTVFLRNALQGILQRGHDQLSKLLILGAYARSHPSQADWGKGGPRLWPNSRPYYTPQDSQDQRGFYIYEWYLSLAEDTLGMRPQIILFQVNASSLFSQEVLLPPEVLACNFWLLAAEPHSPWISNAWFTVTGEPQPGAVFLRTWLNPASVNANLAR